MELRRLKLGALWGVQWTPQNQCQYTVLWPRWAPPDQARTLCLLGNEVGERGGVSHYSMALIIIKKRVSLAAR